jgi:hypothetical protein
VAKFDSSTPSSYSTKQNSGLLALTNGGATITNGAKLYYDALVKSYGLSVRIVPVKQGDGLTLVKDQYNNSVWFIDKEHLVLFQVMASWDRSGIPRDTILDRLLK